MSLDLYRTFAPLKQTTPTMAIACVELSGRVLESRIEDLEVGKGYKNWRTTRAEVMGRDRSRRCHSSVKQITRRADVNAETLLDLLDLYTHHRAATIVGLEHPLEKFIEVRITLNQEASAHEIPRYTQWLKKIPSANGIKTTNGTTKDSKDTRDETKDRKSPPAMGPTAATGVRGRVGERGRDGTVRFMLDAERAREEKNLVAEYFKVEEEEYEVEVERERRKI
ncbi:RNA polymerase II C-terminal domain kinase beta subunit [Acarospora aff. strigata]|nr:RNA polymerase II C-terminal domain kinase beta subunit [Acarospora aff. strigata]